MGLFNEDQIKRLKEMGIKAEANKDYSSEEKSMIAFKVSDYIFSHSTKNNDIRDLQLKNSDILNIL